MTNDILMEGSGEDDNRKGPDMSAEKRGSDEVLINEALPAYLKKVEDSERLVHKLLGLIESQERQMSQLHKELIAHISTSESRIKHLEDALIEVSKENKEDLEKVAKRIEKISSLRNLLYGGVAVGGSGAAAAIGDIISKLISSKN